MPSTEQLRALCPRRRRRTGTTLLELIGGLAVGGIVLALAVRMVTGLSLAVASLNATSVDDTRARNGIRWLAERLRGATAPNDSQLFLGLSGKLSFTAHRANPSNPAGADHVEIAMVSRDLVARVGSDTLRLHADVEGLHIDYLTARGLDGLWHSTWVSSASLPAAIRLRLTRAWRSGTNVDTILLAVGLAL